MNRLGAATAGIGLFSMALNTAGTLWLVCTWCFLQGFCGGIIDAIANAAISAVHGIRVAPWMQGLHFCFSAGALVAPVLVGQFGYRVVFSVFGLVSMPAALACCLVGTSDSLCAWKKKYHFHSESEEGVDDTATPGEGIEIAEANAHSSPSLLNHVTDIGGIDMAEKAEEWLLGLECESHAKPSTGRRQGHFPSMSPSSSRTPRKSCRICSLPTEKRLTEKHGVENALELGMSAAPRGGVILQEAEEDDRAEALWEKHVHSSLPSCGSDKALRDILQAQQQQELQQQLNGEPPPPEGEDEGEEAKPPPFSLVGLLALFSFLYVGAEVGFGGWVAVVVLRDDLAGEVGAALMASLFWGGIAVGRLVAVPLAVRFSTGALVRANLIGGVSSSVLLLVVGRDNIAWAAIGAALFGLFMSSTFPLAMSLLPSVAYALSDKNSSRMVIGGALGEMLVPTLIAALLGSSDGGWPSALYAVCTAISILLMLVYGAWYSVLTAIGRRTDQG